MEIIVKVIENISSKKNRIFR